MNKTEEAMEALDRIIAEAKHPATTEEMNRQEDDYHLIRKALKSIEDERGVMAETIYRWQQTGGELHDKLKAAEAERDTLKAQLTEADEVIRPFAEAYERAHENHKTAFVFRADLSRASQYLKGREG